MRRSASFGVVGLVLLEACSSAPSALDAGNDAALGATVDAGALDGGSLDASAGRDAASFVDAGDVTPFPSFASLLSTSRDATLYVGNSYTYVNDLPSVHRSLHASASPLRIESVTAGGYTLAQHAVDAGGATALGAFLAEDGAFDVVVLQEQSQIPGFGAGNGEYEASLDAAVTLGEAAQSRGASVVLYLTWGRERGDDLNPGLYPDFDTMEARLESGYEAMRARLLAAGVEARIAPVGPAFARVHAAVVEAGDDPTAEGSAFDALYADDGSHPSPAGTYLGACVILATITAEDPLTFAGSSLGLDASAEASLRLVAHDVLADPRWTP